MTRLLLIRHAPTPETGHKLTGRLPGVSLGDAGERVARETATRLAATRIHFIYASPIERTWETALAIAAPHRLTPIPDDGLLEVDYGVWSGRTLKSLYPLKAWRTVVHTPSRMVFPGGEALADAQRRAVRFCEETVARHRGKTVAAVTHADIIKTILSHYLGQPLDLFQRIGVSPASVSVIEFDEHRPPMVSATNTNGALT